MIAILGKIEESQSAINAYNLRIDFGEFLCIKSLLVDAVDQYLNGFPSKAFCLFNALMRVLTQTPLHIYQKSDMDPFAAPSRRGADVLKLYRAVRVDDNKIYQRKRVFHTPYDLRSKVSASRYSIAGYPSLYLGTSLNLCCKEIHVDPYKKNTLAARFELERHVADSNINIRVIELGIKPQDFLRNREQNEFSRTFGRFVARELLDSSRVRSAYLLWYPLIAACSYIRTNKRDPFAAEYIIPQLLMQWVRGELMAYHDSDPRQLIGIRYFSCASVKASDMGFNYVFPTNGHQISDALPYCDVLARAFRLTAPVYIHEYDSVQTCEDQLSRSLDLASILD